LAGSHLNEKEEYREKDFLSQEVDIEKKKKVGWGGGGRVNFGCR